MRTMLWGLAMVGGSAIGGITILAVALLILTALGA